MVWIFFAGKEPLWLIYSRFVIFDFLSIDRDYQGLFKYCILDGWLFVWINLNASKHLCLLESSRVVACVGESPPWILGLRGSSMSINVAKHRCGISFNASLVSKLCPAVNHLLGWKWNKFANGLVPAWLDRLNGGGSIGGSTGADIFDGTDSSYDR